MRLGPKVCRNGQWIDPLALPPGALIAAPVQLPMMQPADRDREAVAHFPPHRPLLRELDVMGIRRGAAADEAGLGGDKFQMLAIAVRPRGKSLRRAEQLKLRHQLAPEVFRGAGRQTRGLWPLRAGSPFGRLQGPSGSL